MNVERVSDEIMEKLPDPLQQLLQSFYKLMEVAQQDLQNRIEAVQRAQEALNADSHESS